MTFSIVAADLDAGDWGVAVASKFPCVGAVVPWACAGVGAVATQSWANTSFGPEGLRLAAEGTEADEVLRRLLEADDGREDRQIGMVDAAGRAATFTGSRCMAWAGGATGRSFAAQGNILVGEQVVADLAAAFTETEGDLCDRLLAALLAGDAAGGDRRDEAEDPDHPVVPRPADARDREPLEVRGGWGRCLRLRRRHRPRPPLRSFQRHPDAAAGVVDDHADAHRQRDDHDVSEHRSSPRAYPWSRRFLPSDPPTTFTIGRCAACS